MFKKVGFEQLFFMPVLHFLFGIISILSGILFFDSEYAWWHNAFIFLWTLVFPLLYFVLPPLFLSRFSLSRQKYFMYFYHTKRFRIVWAVSLFVAIIVILSLGILIPPDWGREFIVSFINFKNFIIVHVVMAFVFLLIDRKFSFVRASFYHFLYDDLLFELKAYREYNVTSYHYREKEKKLVYGENHGKDLLAEIPEEKIRDLGTIQAQEYEKIRFINTTMQELYNRFLEQFYDVYD